MQLSDDMSHSFWDFWDEIFKHRGPCCYFNHLDIIDNWLKRKTLFHQLKMSTLQYFSNKKVYLHFIIDQIMSCQISGLTHVKQVFLGTVGWPGPSVSIRPLCQWIQVFQTLGVDILMLLIVSWWLAISTQVTIWCQTWKDRCSKYTTDLWLLV